jgi:membrane protein
VKTAFAIVVAAVRGFLSDQASSYAAAIAYYTLFSIFPFALFLVGISGYFITSAQRDALAEQISDVLPSGSAGAIYSQIRTVTNGRAALSFLGLVAALWSGSAVFTAVRMGLHGVWKTQNARPWLIAKAIDLASVIGFGVMLTASLAGSLLLTNLGVRTEHVLSGRLEGFVAFVLRALLYFLPGALAYVAFWVLYELASPSTVHWRDTWLGALVAAAGYQAISIGFGIYVSLFGHYDKVYGSLGAVTAFLFFAYLVGSLILFGAEVAARQVELRAARAAAVPTAGSHESGPAAQERAG